MKTFSEMYELLEVYNPLDTYARLIANEIILQLKKNLTFGRWTLNEIIPNCPPHLQEIVVNFSVKYEIMDQPITCSGSYEIRDPSIRGYIMPPHLDIILHYNQHGKIPKKLYSDVYFAVLRTIRHELVHNKQFNNDFSLSQKRHKDENVPEKNDSIAKVIQTLLTPMETEANIEAAYLIAKKQRIPIKNAIYNIVYPKFIKWKNTDLAINKIVNAYLFAIKQRYMI